jgi:two-component system, NarL family, response regulator NreC
MLHGTTLILLMDVEGLLRDGLCALVNSEQDLTLAGVVASTPAVRTIELPYDPDLLIMDFAAPDIGGAEAINAARVRWPGIRVLNLTFSRDNRVIESALRAGVDGYLLKTDSRTEFLAAIESVMAGKRYISPSIFEAVVDGFVGSHDRTRPGESDGLSEREREVMKLIAQGLRTREIAERLSVTSKTVEKHRSNLMRKLGLRSATAVTAYAIAHGYLRV